MNPGVATPGRVSVLGSDLYQRAPPHIQQYLRLLERHLGESREDIAAAFHHWITRQAVYGWVAIGEVFEIDGRSARRWCRNYGMPVRRLPNGKVYARVAELHHWRDSWEGEE